MDFVEQKLSIKHWAEADRPREKLLLKGKHNLTDAELLAIIIGSGNLTQTAVELSRHILADCNNSLDELGKKSVQELTKFKGIGEAKAIGIVAALELGKRRQHIDNKSIERIICSKDIFNVMLPKLADLDYEEFWIITLAKNNKIIQQKKISRGGVSATTIDAKLIFNIALQDVASGLVLAHNHPSGSIKPSEFDIQLTQKIKNAAISLDIRLLDHVIIANKEYYSFADNKLI
jgi:DNA repair protein RadC